MEALRVAPLDPPLRLLASLTFTTLPSPQGPLPCLCARAHTTRPSMCYLSAAPASLGQTLATLEPAGGCGDGGGGGGVATVRDAKSGRLCAVTAVGGEVEVWGLRELE